MKELHKRALFKLMSNSRISDKELAKFLHVSKPTVRRSRQWLEINGFVREWTLIPDFSKLGFKIVSLTFFKTQTNNSEAETRDSKRGIAGFLDKHPNVVSLLHGEGMCYDGVMISLHASFSEFTSFLRELKIETDEIEIVGSFLAGLDDNYHSFLMLKRLGELSCVDADKQIFANHSS
jgi:DNA-binding Lrp family transcriptional regulator